VRAIAGLLQRELVRAEVDRQRLCYLLTWHVSAAFRHFQEGHELSRDAVVWLWRQSLRDVILVWHISDLTFQIGPDCGRYIPFLERVIAEAH
jgi:hypothetical protein